MEIPSASGKLNKDWDTVSQLFFLLPIQPEDRQIQNRNIFYSRLFL